jgi:exopolysaccharide biosynthesis polyprenyl glycosylphosphotransferase
MHETNGNPGRPTATSGGVALREESPAAEQAKTDPRTASHAGHEAHLGTARYGYTFRRALLLADLIGLAVAITAANLALGLAGRSGFGTGPLIVLIAFVPVWVILAQAVDLYHLPERQVDYTYADEFGPVFLITTVWLWLYVLVSAAILPDTTQLFGPGVLWVVGIVAILAGRSVARRISSRRAWYRRSVLLIGDREGTDRVLSRLLRHPEWGLHAVSRLCVDGGQPELDSLDGADVSYSETIEIAEGDDFATRVAAVADDLDVDRVILTGASSNLRERTHLARLLTERDHAVDYVYGEPETLYAGAVLHQLEGLPVLSVQPTRLSRGSAAMKRGLDIAVSSAGLVLLSPLFAAVAILIKLDSRGPVFFRQPRAGRGDGEFKAVKFRTMVDGADSMRAEVREHSIHGNGEGMLKLRDDPRITRVGARLRRWSLDELPQLWNVLRGDMSLVGPRPLPLDEAPLVKDHFEIRTEVRPGITGTWQTHGRSEIPFEDMVKLDYTYVACWSMREDLRLLLRTAAAVTHGRGSY